MARHADMLIAEGYNVEEGPRMYEFKYEPNPRQLMRHQAWQTSAQTLAQIKALNATSGKNPVYGLSTALRILGRQTPKSFSLPDGAPHIVFPTPSEVRRVGNAMRHTWRPLGHNDAVITVDGVQCTSPAATFAHLGAHCSLEDLVMIGDSLTCRDATLRRASVGQLGHFVEHAGQFAGRANAERALRLVQPNTDSPAETRLRLTAMQYGLPRPVTDVVIAKEPMEIRLDAGWPPYRIGMEYQGKHHRDQYEYDLLRANEILGTGWLVFQVTHDMLNDPRIAYMLFDAIAVALRRAGAPIDHAYVEPMTVRELSHRPSGRPARGES